MKKAPLILMMFFLSALLISCGGSSSNDQSDSSDPAMEAEDVSDTDEGSGTLSDECERFLTEYEAWVDQYVELTRQMNQGTMDQQLIDKLTRMSNELSEWQNRTPICTNEEFVNRLEALGQKMVEAATYSQQ